MTALQDEELNVRADVPQARLDGDPAGEQSAQPRTPALLEMLDSLSPTQSEALRLKFQGGLSYKEIAAVMDITANHVGVIIHNAIKALRERSTMAPGSKPTLSALSPNSVASRMLR